MVKILENILLSSKTTLGIGGKAKYFIEITTPKEIKEAIDWAGSRGVEYLVIGGGSNLLVSDNGVEKLVIKNSISGISQKEGLVKVQSGTPLQEFVDFCIQKGLGGVNKLAGIPGSVGGAVYGNAGAYGQIISDLLEEVTCLNREGEAKNFPKKECEFSYRSSLFKKNHYTILEVSFKLPNSDPKVLEEESRKVLDKRLIKYPPNLKCPGSFFKNIVVSELPKEAQAKISSDKIQYGKITAGYLLEEVGAKGQKEGAIEIAPYHANLFVNVGGGTAADFYNLAKRVSERVKEKFNISLEPEVQLINLPPIH